MNISRDFKKAWKRERKQNELAKKQQEQYNKSKKLAKDYLFPQGL